MQIVQRFFNWFTNTFQKQGVIGKIVMILATLVILCCVCSIPVALLNPSKPASETLDVSGLQTAAVNTALANINQTATANAPANTPLPTFTPLPTNTPIPPTATENPNLVKPGTYLVGTEIQPGIYRGEAGSSSFDTCYWARLKDLSGGLDSILANDNSNGQFYIEIRPSDYAIQTRCELVPLNSLPAHTGDFTQEVQPGMYIIGNDIQPGTYKGQADSDITGSCYWARLRNVAGGLDSIIANDNATGQYYVQVTANDFALSTACKLQRVGN